MRGKKEYASMQSPKIEGYHLPAMKTKLTVSKTRGSKGSSVLDSSHSREKKQIACIKPTQWCTCRGNAKQWQQKRELSQAYKRNLFTSLRWRGLNGSWRTLSVRSLPGHMLSLALHSSFSVINPINVVGHKHTFNLHLANINFLLSWKYSYSR